MSSESEEDWIVYSDGEKKTKKKPRKTKYVSDDEFQDDTEMALDTKKKSGDSSKPKRKRVKKESGGSEKKKSVKKSFVSKTAPGEPKTTGIKRKKSEVANEVDSIVEGPKKRVKGNSKENVVKSKEDLKKDIPKVEGEKRKRHVMKLTEDHPVPTVAELYGEQPYYRWWDDFDTSNLTAEQLADLEDEEGDVEDKTVEKKEKKIMWETLEHNGVYFYPEYEAHGVPLVYEGKEIVLLPRAEEVATFYAEMVASESDYMKESKFNANFFKEFKKELNDELKGWSKSNKGIHPSSCISRFELMDFSRIANYVLGIRKSKKERTKEEKLIDKAANDEIKKRYGICYIDGHPVEVSAFKIEPPGLFRGRGQHPKMGLLKRRIQPEDITINCGGPGVVSAEPPVGHHWNDIIENREVTWLASWKETILGGLKYVRPAQTSHFKGQSDLLKFDTARKLSKCIVRVRESYMNFMKSDDVKQQQLGVAAYMIDKLALRAGGEKDQKNAADTVGTCNLRVEHVSCKSDNVILFDFLGKDSVRYTNEVKFMPIAYKRFKEFKKNKNKGALLFDQIDLVRFNKYLRSLMPGLSAKVFRTYNASHKFNKQLMALTKTGTIPERFLEYQRSNRDVALLCNHQRKVPPKFGESMAKLDSRIVDKETKLAELMNTRLLMLKYAQQEFALDPEVTKEEAKKLKETQIKSNFDVYQIFPNREKARESGRRLTEKSIMGFIVTNAKKIDAMKKSIATGKVQKTDKEENKTVSLTTSRQNYLDPRITVAWAKRCGVPITKTFNKTLLTKFPWALEVDPSWTFDHNEEEAK